MALRLIPVVMMSGSATREDRLRAIRAGVTDFLAKPFDPEELQSRVQALLNVKQVTDSLEDAERVIVALARTIDARDRHTAGHSARVSVYAGILGERVGLSPADLLALRQGCLFHDLGKVAIRDEVLFKPGRLTTQEREEMKRHPDLGCDLVQHMRSLERALPVVRWHHERCDGSGYPDGLGRASIPVLARIAAIGDVYDGMTSSRPYRAPMPTADALRAMWSEAEQGWWDVELLDEFEHAVGALPRGRVAASGTAG
jgi:putative two-component system response regulator